MRPIEVRLERSGLAESRHEVHGVVVSGRGKVLGAFGDASLVAFWRSSMKPFQALPFVRGGGMEDEGFGAPELALACASHHGTSEHVDIVAGMLEAVGLTQEALACGPHRPLDESAARALDEAGRLPERIHNNCSGKHAAMLASTVRRSCRTEGYHRPEHPVQVRVRAELEAWLDVDPEAATWGVDGCGVPTPALSLQAMARAYARLATSEDEAARSVASAMTAHPTLVSGPTAFTATLMDATGGRLLAKEGAEGVFCVACPAEGWGAAFKVTDGATRAAGPAVVHALRELGRLTVEERDELATFAAPPVKNTRGEMVAVLRVASDGR